MNVGRGNPGLREISEMPVLPGGALSLVLLGIGQDAQGEIYLLGNINGVPFGNGGIVVRLTPPPEPTTD